MPQGCKIAPRAIWKIFGGDFFFYFSKENTIKKNRSCIETINLSSHYQGFKFFSACGGLKTKHAFKKSISTGTAYHGHYLNLKFCFRLRRVKTITRLQGIYFNRNHLPQPLGKSHPGHKMKFTSLLNFPSQERKKKHAVNQVFEITQFMLKKLHRTSQIDHTLIVNLELLLVSI